jgi:hypothetical protein
MSHYIHQVPGRIRVRSNAFRCRPDKALAAERRLRSMAGVRQVRVNPHAASITIHYDPKQVRRSDLFSAMEEVGCLGATARTVDGTRQVAEMVGKALMGAMIQKAVERSARTLVGALI